MLSSTRTRARLLILDRNSATTPVLTKTGRGLKAHAVARLSYPAFLPATITCGLNLRAIPAGRFPMRVPSRAAPRSCGGSPGPPDCCWDPPLLRRGPPIGLDTVGCREAATPAAAPTT